jgi:hypothetical protein
MIAEFALDCFVAALLAMRAIVSAFVRQYIAPIARGNHSEISGT